MNMTDRSFQYSCVLSGCWDSVSLILFLVFIRGDESSCCVTSMSLSCFPSWLVSPGPDYPPCFHCSLVHCVNVSVLSWLSVFFLPVFLLSDTCMFFSISFLLKFAFCVLLFIHSSFFFLFFFATIDTVAFTSLYRGPGDPGPDTVKEYVFRQQMKRTVSIIHPYLPFCTLQRLKLPVKMQMGSSPPHWITFSIDLSFIFQFGSEVNLIWYIYLKSLISKCHDNNWYWQTKTELRCLVIGRFKADILSGFNISMTAVFPN